MKYRILPVLDKNKVAYIVQRKYRLWPFWISDYSINYADALSAAKAIKLMKMEL